MAAAIADPVRRDILVMLRDQRLAAGQIADRFAISRPAVSRHLRVLRRSGLVEERGIDADARVRIYHLRPEPLVGLRAWVDQVQAFWSDQLDAFRQHVENRSTQ